MCTAPFAKHETERVRPPAAAQARCVTLSRPGCTPLWRGAEHLQAALAELPAPASSDGYLRLEIAVEGVDDPIHWLAHQQLCPRLYFSDQTKTVCVAGVGAAETMGAAGAPDEATWRQAARALHGASRRMRFYGGARFDPQRPAAHAPEWEAFGGCMFVLPLVELQSSGAHTPPHAPVAAAHIRQHALTARHPHVLTHALLAHQTQAARRSSRATCAGAAAATAAPPRLRLERRSARRPRRCAPCARAARRSVRAAPAPRSPPSRAASPR